MSEHDKDAVTQALCRLQESPQDAAAFGVVEAFVQRRTRVLVDRADWRQDIAQDVLLKVFERLVVGTLEIKKSAAGYLSQAVKNAFTDRLRAKRRERELQDRVQAQTRAQNRGEADAPLSAAMEDPLALLDKVAAAARRQRLARYRDSFDKDWREVIDLGVGNRSIDQLIAAQLGDPAIGPGHAAWRTAANRLYKRHARLRQALAEAGTSMTAQGRLDEAEAAWLPILLTHLASGQHRGPAVVSAPQLAAKSEPR